MSLDDFNGKWGVMTSGRNGRLPAGFDQHLCIYTKDITPWTLKTQKGNDMPVPFGNRQWDHGYQDVLFSQEGGGVQRMQRIYCKVEFVENSERFSYCFEAVLAAIQPTHSDLRVVYGHLYPLPDQHPWQGEGAVGGWSADRQGDPPNKEEG